MCFTRFWKTGIRRGYGYNSRPHAIICSAVQEGGKFIKVMQSSGLTSSEKKIQYPLSEKMMRPASNPNYYDGLLKELNEAPTRSWLQSTINRWKGFLRFS